MVYQSMYNLNKNYFTTYKKLKRCKRIKNNETRRFYCKLIAYGGTVNIENVSMKVIFKRKTTECVSNIRFS